MNSDNCCPQNIRMCTQDELRTGRFSNPNTRCDSCALGPYGRPQICPMTGLPCPAATNENTCRAPDGKCITVCDGQNCCADNIPMCTDEDLRGRFSNANTRCDPCAMGPDGSPQRCPLTGQPCPQSNPQNSCRVINNDGTMNCITLCDGSRPGPRPIPPRPIPPRPTPARPTPAPMYNSYYCHSTTRNCEGSPLPPDLSQNRFATKEECERVMKLCRRPGPRPIPPGPRTCHICQEVDGMVVDDPNTCMRADPNHDINNCCCEAGQMCRIPSGPRQGQEACNPVWAKAQLDANAACPPGFSWNSYASQTSGLPCVRM